MKKLKNSLLLASLITCALTTSVAIAGPSKITTKILEVQNWDGDYYFKIENPTSINPASCAVTDFVQVRSFRTSGVRPVPVPSIIESLIEARLNNSTITILVAESYCSGKTVDIINDFQSPENRFPAVRAVIY